MNTELPDVVISPKQEEMAKETMAFMRKFWSKITLFLSLSDGWTIKNPEDEFILEDLEEIDAFFEKYADISIKYDSEIANQKIHLSLETIAVLKPRISMRILGKFLDIFDASPSERALEGVISAAKAYEACEWVTLISEETLEKKRRQISKINN